MAIEPKGSGLDTVPVGAVSTRQPGREPHPQRALLLLYHRDGATAVPLRAGVGVVIGREPPADIVLPEASLSRRHARFTLENGEIIVCDLGSLNGTLVRGRR